MTPSPQIISALSSALEPAAAEALTLAYCETLFPERAKLFSRTGKRLGPGSAPAIKNAVLTPAPVGQKTLTPAQVACIARSRLHYYAFLILTLARGGVARAALAQTLRAQELDGILAELEISKLIRTDSDMACSIANEMRFPDPDSSQKKLHEQIDQWNLGFHQEMGFDPIVQKMLLRRVSTRYLSLIQSQCAVLVDMLRISDEIEDGCNEEVVMLNLSLQHGRLPG